MRVNRLEDDEEQPAGDAHLLLLKAATEWTGSEADAEKLLQQCADYFHNKRLLQRHIKRRGLKLANEFTSAQLQLYFEITFEGETLAFISRGWDESGFRLGQVLCIAKKHAPELRQQTKEISKLLATNGIAITGDEDAATGDHHLNLTINIPDAGFNAKTLSDALIVLSACIARIKGTLPCD